MRDVDFTQPRPALDAQAAAWLATRIRPGDDHWVIATAGAGFEAYARVFHPLDDGPHPPRWADVAARHGRTMHASAQWEHISSSSAPIDPTDRGRGFPGEPHVGNLDPDALAALGAVLASHTATADRCWFAVWNGWGWQHPGAQLILSLGGEGAPATPIDRAPDSWQLDLTGATFVLPHREYHLFTGPVADAARIGHWVTAEWFDPQSPSLFWPADQAWCVATEIDFDSTLVAGSADLIADVLASPALEALPIAPDAPYQDLINT